MDQGLVKKKPVDVELAEPDSLPVESGLGADEGMPDDDQEESASAEDAALATGFDSSTSEDVDEQEREIAPAARAARAFRIDCLGLSDKQAAAILANLTSSLAPTKVVSVSSPEVTANLLVRGFDEGFDRDLIDREIESPPVVRAKRRIFLERRSPTPSSPEQVDADNRTVAKLAAVYGATLLSTSSLFARYDENKIFDGGELSEFGATVLAQAVQRIFLSGRKTSEQSPSPNPHIIPPDVADAKALAGNPIDLLSKLSWDAPQPPKLIGARIQRNSIEAFVQSQLVLPGRSHPIAFDQEVDWGINLNDREAEAFFGLDFLTSILGYWYAKANGREGGEIGAIDALLKEKGVTASKLLHGTGSIIRDFVGSCTRSAVPKAWQQLSLALRARALTMFLLCCRSAAKRRIRFDGELCRIAFCGLLDSLEVLRDEGQSRLGSVDGIRQLSFLVGLALPLRRINYGKMLLHECFARLNREHLAVGVSENGVWQNGTFEDHCAVVRLMVPMLSATRPFKIPTAVPVLAVAGKMANFMEAMLRCDGLPPPIDHIPPVSRTKLLRVLRAASPSRASQSSDISSTHFFPREGYFISHSKETPNANSSQVVLHTYEGSARRKRLGRMSLGFSIGATDLIVGGGAVCRKSPKELLDASRGDLGTGNEYRVDGKSYTVVESNAPRALTMEKSWQGQGWAAATISNAAHANAVIARTVVHLKPIHVLIVVDELRTKDEKEALFEQFWHIAPDFAPSEHAQHFSSGPSNFLLIASGATADIGTVVDAGSSNNPIGWTLDKSMEPVPNSYLCRRMRTSRGLAVSSFQWAKAPGLLAVKEVQVTESGWIVSASGENFDLRFGLSAGELRRIDRTEN